MSISHTNSIPRELPFHADSFRWDDFERFCATWLVTGTTLPNLTLDGNEGPSRLKVVDSLRIGVSGEKQHGIDILATMENRATWVVQCKHMAKFGKTDASKAIEKAKREFGSYQPTHYLIWVTGKVTADATLLAHKEDSVTLWSAERLTTDVVLHTPPGQCRQLIRACFGPEWAKAFFPIGDQLLLTEAEFFSRWESADRSFHHHAALAGRAQDLRNLVKFAQGGVGKKALILSAAGGIGKSRLLREVAREVERSNPERWVRFINPNASRDADLLILKDIARTTIIHDDAHRMDLRREVLAAVFQKEAEGVRLILSTRPGAEDSLRQQLMDAGFAAADIRQPEKLKKLSKSDLTALVISILGPQYHETARALAKLSDGCALIALVGAELLRSGEINHLDLARSDSFRMEVFTRFEGQELARIGGRMERPLLTKLLRSIALLSPWAAHEPECMRNMAEFLGIQRGQIEAACDELQQGGLLVRTQNGLRITPDLFADHLVYSACYDDKGRSTDFLHDFLKHFVEGLGGAVVQNLAEAEWRASRKHDSAAQGILEPIWRGFLEEFERFSFWERSQMIDRWSAFAIYQPDRSLELVRWAIEWDNAPMMSGYDSLDTHDQVLSRLPSLLKPIAIWSNAHRPDALSLMWKLHQKRSANTSSWPKDPFGEFAEVAKFSSNFPEASTGVLDWLEGVLGSDEADQIADQPCGLLSMVLSPYFARHIRQDYMSDHRTFVMRTIPISVAKTRPLRDRAFLMITEKLIPRGTVAAINVLPVLGAAFRYSSSMGDLPPEMDRAWQPERKKALHAIGETACSHQHPLVHFVIRRQLSWHVVYGKDESDMAACRRIIDELADSFEFRLARLTLSWDHEDSLTPYNPDRGSGWYERQKAEWRDLLASVASELIARKTITEDLHAFLENWHFECSRHGLQPHFGELMSELARCNQQLALELLELVLALPDSPLCRNAASLIGPKGGLPDEALVTIVRSGLSSPSLEIVQSFVNLIEHVEWLQTQSNIDSLFAAAEPGHPQVIQMLIGALRYPRARPWTEALAFHLLGLPMADELLNGLAGAITYVIRYSDRQPGAELIGKLLSRLKDVKVLPDDHEGGGFLSVLAKKHPRMLLDFFKTRIAMEEALSGNNTIGYASVPYFDGPPLLGIEKDPEFEILAKSILQEFLSRPSEDRHPWRQLFIMAVSRTSPSVEGFLLGILSEVRTPEDLVDVCSLTRFSGSRIAYRHPNLIEALLSKAHGFGREDFEKIQWELIHSAMPQGRGYTNGRLDPEYAYALPAAEEAMKHAEGRPLLMKFYRKIVEIEKADAERARREEDDDLTDDWD